MIVRYIKSIYRANINTPIKSVKMVNMANYNFMQKSPFSNDAGAITKKVTFADNIIAAFKYLKKVLKVQ